jgi:uncharacterized ferritin-like protein (DUF455 family)
MLMRIVAHMAMIPVSARVPASTPVLELRLSALQWLAEPDAASKAAGVTALAQLWSDGGMALDISACLSADYPIPGRPAKPELVPPHAVKKRALQSLPGRAALIHALAHIEFNAINLALDAIWRFAGMPADYYRDWLQVSQEEALHFSLLVGHLERLGHVYGDFPAHDSLWEMAARTEHDVLARMALVPRTLEARGLDATPLLRAKLAQAGDQAAADILDIILRDEIGHVAIGNRWFAWLCTQRDLEPVQTYRQLAQEHRAPVLRGPFNMAGRRAAGFSEAELQQLLQVANA